MIRKTQMLTSNPSHKIPDHKLRDEMIFFGQKALTGPRELAASDRQLAAEAAEMPMGPTCLFLVMMALLTGPSAADSSNVLSKTAGWATKGKRRIS